MTKLFPNPPCVNAFGSESVSSPGNGFVTIIPGYNYISIGGYSGDAFLLETPNQVDEMIGVLNEFKSLLTKAKT